MDKKYLYNNIMTLLDPIPDEIENRGDERKVTKEKLAPRSSLQFKVGPQFSPTTQGLSALYSTHSPHIPIVSKISARIDRGFEKEGDEWIGYKRNYFTLVSSFEFPSMSLKTFLETEFYVVDNFNNAVGVRFFGLKLISTCVEDGTFINLVQHTAKRDRGPQQAPPVYPAVPGKLPDHETIKEAANVRNSSKIEKINRLFYLSDMDYRNGVRSSDETNCLRGYPTNIISKVARYERVQFSSSINYRKPTSVVRHFNLVVQLIAHLENGVDVVVGFIESPSLIIRGRSPSNYQSSKQREASTGQNAFRNMHFASLSNDFRDSQITLENSDGCTNQYLTRSENETTESPEEVFTPHDEFELDPRIADGGEVHLEMFLPEYYMTDHENVNPMDSLEIFNPERELKMIDSILAELQGTKSETTNKAGERKRHDLPFENNGLWRGPIDNQYNHLPSDENNPFPLPYMIMPKIVDGYHLETFSTDEELEHTSGLSLSPIKRFNQLADIEWNTKRDTDAYGDGNIPKGTDCLTGRFSLEIQSFSSENNLFENPSSYLKGLEGMEDDCPTFLMSEI